MLIILLICHMIADFFLQSSNMAERKITSIKILLLHCATYTLIFTIANLVFFKVKFAILTTLIISILHFIIDFIRIKIDNTFSNDKIRFFVFVIDQLLHLTVIFTTYYLLNLATKTNSIYKMLEKNTDFTRILAYALLFVFLLDPVAVFIKKLFAAMFQKNQNSTDCQETAINNAGSIIGRLERTIIAILLLCNQFGVIGLVLTAKSIARYKQLENQNFAEKYLVGTLISLLISLISTILIKYFLL